MKKKVTIFIIAFLLLEGCGMVAAYAQTLSWAKQLGGENDDFGLCITTDASGNVYTTGNFSGIADFDPGVGTFNLTSAGDYDAFISKLDASGNFIWAKSMGGTDAEYDYSIDVDASGNVYTMGWFYGTADFDPGEGTFNLTSAGNADIFISKLDSSGNFVWATKIGGASMEQGASKILDDSGNIYTTGYFYGTVDFDPGPGIFNLTPIGEYDIFICKLNSSGNFVWAKAMGGPLSDYVLSIALDNSGNIYTTGEFYDTADFNPGDEVFNLTSAGNDDIFVSKLDASGNFVWAKRMGGPGLADYDYGFSVAVDALGNVYTTGSFGGTADFDPGEGTFNLLSKGAADIFISKLDSSGNFVWAKNLGGGNDDQGISLSLDVFGNVYTTGNFSGLADFDPGEGAFYLSSAGQGDIFISIIDASGSFVWAGNMGGTGYDSNNSVALDASGNIYTTGYFGEKADFDPGEGIFNLAPAGMNDICVVKLLSPLVGIKSVEYNGKIVVYPNPAHDFITIDSESPIHNIIIVDAIGKVVFQQNIYNNKASINTSDLSNGIYLIKTSGEKQTSQSKLIINR
jgi:hypothetical protein